MRITSSNIITKVGTVSVALNLWINEKAAVRITGALTRTLLSKLYIFFCVFNSNFYVFVFVYYREVDKSEIDPSWGDMSGSGKEDAPKEQTEPKEAAPPGEGGDAPPAEEEPKQFTLDEWRAQKAGRQKPQYNLRKAGEGEDPTQWKKMYELSKKKEGEEDDSDDEEYDASEYPQRVGRQKHVLDIDIHFNDTRRGGVGGRGRGRSGPRGQRGGGGPPRGDREPRERQGPRPFRGAGATGGGPTGTPGGLTDEVSI